MPARLVDLEQTFLDKTMPIPESGCWIFLDHLNHSGYGQLLRRTWGEDFSHRWAYKHWRGPIPVEMEIDHLCRVRCCCNPAHLEVVTKAENCARGIARAAKLRHCSNGHLFTPDDVRRNHGEDRRRCRICHRNAERARRLQGKRAQLEAADLLQRKKDVGRADALMMAAWMHDTDKPFDPGDSP